MRFLFLLAMVSLLGPILHADTIRLRNGQEYQGVVIAEEGDDYVVMVQVTKTIRDQRRIPKKDILEIVQEKKDTTAYDALKKVVPTPDGLDVKAYDNRIALVEEFLKRFPDSRYKKEVGKFFDTLHEERDIVASGGVKFDGELLGPEERKAAAFSVDSQIIAAEMDEAIEKRRRIDALRAWDRLAKEFPTSRAFRDGLPKILPVMRRQLSAVNRELETIDDRIEERLTKLDRVPDKDRARAKAAIEAQAAEYLKRVEDEREAGIRWTSLDPYQKDPLSKARSLLESEIRRLENLDMITLPDGDGAWAEAWETLSGEPSRNDARDAVSQARNARLPKKYLDMLEAMVPEQ